MHVTAHFFTGKGSVPDLDGCMVGLGDLLQRAGILSNDRWVGSWDGTRIIEWRDHGLEPCTMVRFDIMDTQEIQNNITLGLFLIAKTEFNHDK